MVFAIALIMLVTADISFEEPRCEDVSGWKDAFGYDCAFYTEKTCATFGSHHFTEAEGHVARTACCVCGGGGIPTETPTATPTANPTESPTREPTAAPTTCMDAPDWTDAFGFDCSDYDQNACHSFGLSPLTAQHGMAASTACCECGGGNVANPTTSPTVTPTGSPTESPTPIPTTSPTLAPTECEDVEGWRDAFGFDCSKYETLCHTFGHQPLLAKWGLTATSACCVCGGGSHASLPLSLPRTDEFLTAPRPTVAPTTSPTTSAPAEDLEFGDFDFLDSLEFGTDFLDFGDRVDFALEETVAPVELATVAPTSSPTTISAPAETGAPVEFGTDFHFGDRVDFETGAPVELATVAPTWSPTTIPSATLETGAPVETATPTPTKAIPETDFLGFGDRLDFASEETVAPVELASVHPTWSPTTIPSATPETGAPVETATVAPTGSPTPSATSETGAPIETATPTPTDPTSTDGRGSGMEEEREIVYGEPIVSVIYSSGKHQHSLNTGVITGVVPGMTYSVKIEVLRNDLGDSHETVAHMRLDDAEFGGCKPDGGDYDCTFFHCPIEEEVSMFTATKDSISVEMGFVEHSWDCDCDMDTWDCSKQLTVPGRTKMTAVARFTLTPIMERGWKLLLRQTAPYYLSNKEAWMSLNEGNSEAPNFSVLDTLSDSDKGDDGKFHFKLTWPEIFGETEQEWKQSSNPLKTTGVEGYEPISVPYSSHGWNGLKKSTTVHSLIDGSVDNGAWLTAVGTTGGYNDGIIGPVAKPVSIVEFWAYTLSPKREVAAPADDEHLLEEVKTVVSVLGSRYTSKTVAPAYTVCSDDQPGCTAKEIVQIVECPAQVSKLNWVGSDQDFINDKFSVALSRDKKKIRVERTDIPAGWAMDLSIVCTVLVRGTSAPTTSPTPSPTEIDIQLEEVAGEFPVANFGETTLVEGAVQFGDRPHTLANIPRELQGARYFQGPSHTHEMELHLSFYPPTKVFLLYSRNTCGEDVTEGGLQAEGFHLSDIDASKMTSESHQEPGFWVWESEERTELTIKTTRDWEVTIAYNPVPIVVDVHVDHKVLDGDFFISPVHGTPILEDGVNQYEAQAQTRMFQIPTELQNLRFIQPKYAPNPVDSGTNNPVELQVAFTTPTKAYLLCSKHFTQKEVAKMLESATSDSTFFFSAIDAGEMLTQMHMFKKGFWVLESLEPLSELTVDMSVVELTIAYEPEVECSKVKVCEKPEQPCPLATWIPDADGCANEECGKWDHSNCKHDCSLAVDKGDQCPSTPLPHSEHAERWFFDASTQTCKPFHWLGCSANSNNFATRKLCQAFCEPNSPVEYRTTKQTCESEGFKVIDTVEECEIAAAALRLPHPTVSVEHDVVDKPAGCFVHEAAGKTSSLEFNIWISGNVWYDKRGTMDIEQICKKEEQTDRTIVLATSENPKKTNNVEKIAQIIAGITAGLAALAGIFKMLCGGCGAAAKLRSRVTSADPADADQDAYDEESCAEEYPLYEDA